MAAEAIPTKPSYVVDLEKSFGAASQAAFGSAVFFDSLSTADSVGGLEQHALAKYKYFCGETWERYGEAAWLSTWKELWARSTGGKRDVIAALRAISEPDVRMSALMLLDSNDHGQAAHQALVNAFDHESVTELQVFRIGDGEAMSGLLLAARRSPDGAIVLVFLMD